MDNKNCEPLASEMYADLKQSIKFKERLVVFLLAIIILLVIALAATNVYHIYQWSQFDTVVVDSSEGPANYVQGDNTGGIYNGSGDGSETEERQIKGDAN